MRKMLASLLLSPGTPTLLGDDWSAQPSGNNNADCQDNEIKWLDWPRLLSGRACQGRVRAKVAHGSPRAANAAARPPLLTGAYEEETGARARRERRPSNRSSGWCRPPRRGVETV